LCELVRNSSDKIQSLLMLLAQGADPNAAISLAENSENILYYTALVVNGAHPQNALHSTLTMDDVADGAETQFVVSSLC
jgi:hypothetical protein